MYSVIACLSAMMLAIVPTLALAADPAPSNQQISVSPASDPAVFSEPQKTAIEDVVRRLLVKEPELIVKAAQEMHRR